MSQTLPRVRTAFAPRSWWRLAGIMAALLLLATSAPAADLYVAPDGDDRWSGRLPGPSSDGTDGPLATLAGARDAVRRILARRAIQQAIRVQFADGEYVLDEPVIFGPQDSGTPLGPVLYQAAPQARPVFTGGRRIRGLAPGEGGVWSVKVPWLAAQASPRTLRLRQEEDGYFGAGDTFLSGRPDDKYLNFGAAAVLRVGNEPDGPCNTLIQFRAPPIPPGSLVLSATLSLKVLALRGPSPARIGAYPLLFDFVAGRADASPQERAASWAQRATGFADWREEGATRRGTALSFSADADRFHMPDGWATGPFVAGQWLELDVTASLQAQRAEWSFYGWVVDVGPGAEPGAEIQFAASDSPELADRPTLTVRFRPPRRFEQLWIDGRRAVRATSPNKFFHFAADGAREMVNPRTGRTEHLGRRAFIARPHEIAMLSAVAADQLREVTIVAYHSWEAVLHRVGFVDAATAMVMTTAEAPYTFWEFSLNTRYRLENFRAALDAPGEWFLDPEGTLYCIPLPGQHLGQVEVIAPMAGQFIHFAGQPHSGRFVQDIQLDGLAFRHGRYLLPPVGHSDAQAAHFVPAVIMADAAHRVAILNCEIAQTGTYAFWFRQACRGCRVERTHMHDLGAGGMRIGEGFVEGENWGTFHRDPATCTSHIGVHNNIIYDGGKVFPGAVSA